MQNTKRGIVFLIDGYEVSATFADRENSAALGQIKQILLSSSLVTESEAKCAELQKHFEDAKAAYDEGQTILNSLNAQYDDIISWADMYDSASFEAKKMIVNCLIGRVEVFRGYKLHIDFKIDFEQFSLGIDIPAVAA